MKMKNKIFAILAAPAAMPPNPKIPAMIANMIKVIVHRNIMCCFKVKIFSLGKLSYPPSKQS